MNEESVCVFNAVCKRVGTHPLHATNTLKTKCVL